MLRTGDVLLSVSVQIHGGVHASLRAKIQEWARLTSDGSPADASRVLRILHEQRLSMALMRARVGYVQGSLRKLRGVVARSGSAGYALSHLVTVAHYLGHRGGR